MPEIHHQLTIHATPEAVYDALTRAEGLASWWTTDVVAEPRVGAVAEFGFNNRRTVFRMEITELRPSTSVRWRCVGGHPEWDGTEIVFALTPAPEGTVLRLHHLRWQWRDGVLAQCSFDWARYLMSLRAYAETGTGTPHGEAVR
ncbi:MAG: SRPBCC domain-containing protein [Gemmatimonadota bacterium]|nr:SRPBCC domain-containing protein [Gemmatimonadota bacterium]